MENPTTLTREFPRYSVKYEKGPITPVGHRINLKSIMDPNDRLKVFSQLINDNVGNEDSYKLIPNWFVPSDRQNQDGMVPSFTTATTYPPVPNSETFRCGSLAANAEDLVRASELIDVETYSTGTPEEKRLNALIGKKHLTNFGQMTIKFIAKIL